MASMQEVAGVKSEKAAVPAELSSSDLAVIKAELERTKKSSKKVRKNRSDTPMTYYYIR